MIYLSLQKLENDAWLLYCSDTENRMFEPKAQSGFLTYEKAEAYAVAQLKKKMRARRDEQTKKAEKETAFERLKKSASK